MSKKAVDKYFEEICEQYHEMLEDIRDLEKECSNGIVEPERIERLKSQIEPLKQNYERWSYMMFLLNQPERKSKVKRYQAQNKKLIQNLNKSNSIEATLQENENVLQELKN